MHLLVSLVLDKDVYVGEMEAVVSAVYAEELSGCILETQVRDMDVLGLGEEEQDGHKLPSIRDNSKIHYSVSPLVPASCMAVDETIARQAAQCEAFCANDGYVGGLVCPSVQVIGHEKCAFELDVAVLTRREVDQRANAEVLALGKYDRSP